jgi:signal transduction histidine kinase
MQTVLADEKQLQLINEVAADLPPVSVDVELVRRVFQNVIGNAIKFTPPDGTVRVSAQIDPSDERMLTVCVCDTGPGVPLDLQPRLFEKFVTGRSHGRGSGLGLAFCRLVLEAHGGRIWVESGAGPGAMFKFTLPIVE